MDKNYTCYGECRCCLVKGYHRDIMKEYYVNGTREVYIDIFMECFNLFLSTNKQISALICVSCVQKLKEANSFRLLVISSEEQLLDSITDKETVFVNVGVQSEVKTELQSDVKVEQDDSVFDCEEFLCDEVITETKDEEIVDREAEILSRFPFTNKLPDRRSLYTTCKGFVTHLDLLEEINTGKSLLICCQCIQQLRDANSFRTLVMNAEIHLHDGLGNENTVFINTGKNPLDTEVKLENVKEDNENLEVNDHDNEEGICHEDYVSGELELLSRHNYLKPLPSRESLKYICKKYYKELELLKGQIITAKSIKIDNTDSVSNRIDPKSFVTEKLAHINNVTTILENCNLTAFKTKRRYGYICFYCSRKFDKIELLADHQVEGRCKDGIKSIISKHPSDSLAVYVHVADMKCSICDKKLPNMNELKHHLMATHKKKIYTGYGDRIIPFELGKNKYDCQICGSSYETFGAVERHMNVHYRNYICDQCGVGFVTKNRLRVHIRSAHVTGSYPCDVCDKIFQAQHKYKNHVDVTHRMVKKNKCPKCPERFADYFHRHKHMVDAHGETPLLYKCNVCEALFKRRYALSCHTKRRHLDMRDVNCDVCPYKCYTITELKAHMIKHNGQRTYECNVCKKSYARKKTLKEHMRIHNNDRRYVCAVCGQGFVQNCSLKGHMKTHHTEYLNNLPR